MKKTTTTEIPKSTTHSFFVPCNPPTSTAQQQKRIGIIGGRARMYVSKKGKAIESELTSLLLPHVPKESTFQDGAIELSVIIEYPFRKSEKKSITKAGKSIPHTSKPDCDNLAKMILDTMTRLNFWRDDSQIFLLTIAKTWGANAGIKITIRKV